jgi:hypothetical protein
MKEKRGVPRRACQHSRLSRREWHREAGEESVEWIALAAGGATTRHS